MELDELTSIITEVLSVDASEVTLGAKFVDDLGADSLEVFQIVSEVEERLQIQIKEEALEQIVTVKDALDAINETV